ncbi:MAG: hypothetical protein QOG56_904 [Solirubrobacteraceae bacterium]|nr:hypothetical protein [Solirubrobacteraceae bacterium]
MRRFVYRHVMSTGPVTVQRQDLVLVSPMDVTAERERVELVVTELNRTVAERLGCTLRLRRWETDTQPGLDPGGSQAQVEKGLKIPDADLVIGIFWKRFGTPVEGARSGTESELRLAWSSWLRKRRPEVMLYFCERGFFPGSQAELEQLQSVLAFRRGLPKQQLHWAFREVDEFERMLREHLIAFVTSTNDPASKRRTSASQGKAVLELSTRLSEMSRNVSQLSVTAHNLDMMYEVDLVEADHETVASHCSEEPGGSGANTSVAVAKLGFTTSTTGIVADDPPGTALIEALRETDNMQPEIKVVQADRDTSTGRTIVVSDRRGRRSIYVHPGVNECWASMLTPVERNQLIQRASEAKIVHFTSFTGSEELALQTEILRHLAPETVVSFNPGTLYVERSKAELQPFVDRMNVMTIYEAQLGVLVSSLARTGAAAADVQGQDARTDLERLFSLRDQGVDQPVVILVKRYRPMDPNDLPSGRMYALAVAGRFTVEEQVYPQPDRRPPANRWRMIDSTGAGDAMAAGLHVGLLDGADLQECVNIAFVMAMEVSNAAGARAGQPDLQRLKEAWELWFRSKPPACLR